MRFIVAFLARCYRAERRGRFVWLYWRLRQRGEGSAAGPVETVPRRGAAIRLFQRYDTTAGRGSACVALFVLQGPAAACGMTAGATRGMFSTVLRGCRGNGRWPGLPMSR
jgi:hypothetical protein